VDVNTALITMAISAVTGIGAAALFLWRTAGAWHTFKQKTTDDIHELRRDCDDLEEDLNKHDRELKDFIADQSRQWRDISRSLGVIEGTQNRRSKP